MGWHASFVHPTYVTDEVKTLNCFIECIMDMEHLGLIASLVNDAYTIILKFFACAKGDGLLIV